jgi:hypothetical protein
MSPSIGGTVISKDFNINWFIGNELIHFGRNICKKAVTSHTEREKDG